MVTTLQKLTARDVMNSRVMVVAGDMTVNELAAFLTENEISGAPVVSDEGRLLGVVSLADIAMATNQRGGALADRSDPQFWVRGWEDSLNPEDFSALHIEGEGMLVRDVMTKRFVSVGEETTVSEIARTMVDNHYHRVVVTRGDELVGIITTMDMLGLLTGES